jgi:hypothetical protein
MWHRERDRQRQWYEIQRLEAVRNRDNETKRKRQGGAGKQYTEKET